MKQRTLFDAFSEGACTQCFPRAALLLRLAMGYVFLASGLSKLFQADWSAAGFLAVSDGPFSEMFQALSGSMVVDQLNIWGQILIGAALILGFGVRTASFFGVILMGLYYMAQFETNTAHGFIDEHIIYALVFLLFLVGGFGHVYGLDSLIEQRLSKKMEWFKFFLG
ncbi:hypothetical protein CO174_01315 [Candidatus Uhrbacteria bacterium CG_4_9_14_3_um_filter_50_9]|uniref:DoxX family protein n=1 Tax=Candidatus Uhrbacteria bacterium CG_4_9_14_3_um_filter_50_9 TaxID=1975035 RepID=A0A2M7XDF8_9BACT|nr:MAG: hypothetical protein CO174_01315 [Candidatus Uhrbacteria bacterium CG_4_9_14_3_um_filter_50_9]